MTYANTDGVLNAHGRICDALRATRASGLLCPGVDSFMLASLIRLSRAAALESRASTQCLQALA